jgi:hypothetical protein
MSRNLYIYVYKWNITQGRPSMGWLWKCKWFYVAYDEREKERFMRVVSELERRELPFVKLMFKATRIKGLLVIKVLKLRDFLSFWLPDYLYDAIITVKRLSSLDESGLWNVEEWPANPELLALYEVGKGTTIRTKLSEIRTRYEELKNALEV